MSFRFLETLLKGEKESDHSNSVCISIQRCYKACGLLRVILCDNPGAPAISYTHTTGCIWVSENPTLLGRIRQPAE